MSSGPPITFWKSSVFCWQEAVKYLLGASLFDPALKAKYFTIIQVFIGRPLSHGSNVSPRTLGGGPDLANRFGSSP